ncbi:hypothetical protein IC235_18780 [Hymenobacter sp. BT664]|uniref:Uncharacterized protein n=1 Tax=Hymenobacter montanus TaxID=2771359 RepID=A0A927BGW3_9BACT|nr:hypothetical protein [Hymenobacter montanus]MBD2769939.1 hypothetical protein [Hymenobacter montanus]
MRRILLVLLVLACSAQQVMAQNTPLSASPAELSAGKRDTLRAIGNLFERRRKSGKRWTYVGVVGVLAMVRALTSTRSDGSSLNAGGAAIIAGAFVGVPAAASLGNLLVYSEEHEDEVDRAYRAGQPLPKRIRHRLKKKDFE